MNLPASTSVLGRSRTLGGSGRETAEEFRVPQSLAQLLQGPRGLAGRRSPRLGGGARGASLSCAPPPPKLAVRSPQGAALQAPAGSVQREAGLHRDLSLGVAPAHCGPHAVLGAPSLEPCLSWPEAPVLALVGRGCLGTPTCRVGGCPRLPSTSVPRVLLVQYSQQQLSLQAAGWSPGSGADSPEAGV